MPALVHIFFESLSLRSSFFCFMFTGRGIIAGTRRKRSLARHCATMRPVSSDSRAHPTPSKDYTRVRVPFVVWLLLPLLRHSLVKSRAYIRERERANERVSAFPRARAYKKPAPEKLALPPSVVYKGKNSGGKRLLLLPLFSASGAANAARMPCSSRADLSCALWAFFEKMRASSAALAPEFYRRTTLFRR